MKALKNWGLNKIRTRDKLRYTDAELLSISDQDPVARSMVSVSQRLIPWQRIGFDTAQPMVKANHALSNSVQANLELSDTPRAHVKDWDEYMNVS